MSDRFTVFRSTFDALKAFPAEDMKSVFVMIGEYALDGILPDPEASVAYGLFCSIRPLIDNSAKKAAAGRAGGEATQKQYGGKVQANLKQNRSTTEAPPKQAEANAKQSASTTEQKIKDKREKIKELDSSCTNVHDSPPTGGVAEEWNSLQDLGITPIKAINPKSKRAEMLKARIRQYGEDGVIDAIREIRNSRFLCGHNKSGWMITFDWFLKPSNFLKVSEGNYADRDGNSGDRFAWIDDWARGES